jgi:hypothetical protein
MDLAIRKLSAAEMQKAEVPGLTGRSTSISVIAADGLGISCRSPRIQVGLALRLRVLKIRQEQKFGASESSHILQNLEKFSEV